MTNQIKTEADLRCDIIDQLNLLDPALGAGGSRYIADKWLDAAREIYAPKEIDSCYMNEIIRRANTGGV